NVYAAAARELSGLRSKWSARFDAAERKASGERAERTINSPDRAPGSRRDNGGASSSTTWAFVPPTPKALTPARRGCPLVVDHSRSFVFTKNGLFSRSSLGLGFSK